MPTDPDAHVRQAEVKVWTLGTRGSVSSICVSVAGM